MSAHGVAVNDSPYDRLHVVPRELDGRPGARGRRPVRRRMLRVKSLYHRVAPQPLRVRVADDRQLVGLKVLLLGLLVLAVWFLEVPF